MHSAASGPGSDSTARPAEQSVAASVDGQVEMAQHDTSNVVRYPAYLAQQAASSDHDRKSRLLELHRAALVSRLASGLRSRWNVLSAPRARLFGVSLG